MVLDVEAGAALLAITRTTMDTGGEPIEFSHDLFRADRARIIVRTPGCGGLTHAAPARGRVIELNGPQAGPAGRGPPTQARQAGHW